MSQNLIPLIHNVPIKSARERLTPYLYLAPAIIFILVVFIYPIIYILQTSLTEVTADRGTVFGVANYNLVFNDPLFFQAAANNIKLLFAVPVMAILAILISLLLFEQVAGWQIYRTAVFMPYILAVPVVATVFIYLLGYNGIINTILRQVGLDVITQDWLGNSNWVIVSIGVVIIYRELGFGVVLFLARLMSIDREILEAAEIDGAQWWQKHVYVTLPQMADVIKFYMVVEFITMLSWVFAYVYTMTGGGPGGASNVMEFYIWKHAFSFHSPGIASALAMILLVSTTVLIAFQLRLRQQPLDEE